MTKLEERDTYSGRTARLGRQVQEYEARVARQGLARAERALEQADGHVGYARDVLEKELGREGLDGPGREIVCEAVRLLDPDDQPRELDDAMFERAYVRMVDRNPNKQY